MICQSCKQEKDEKHFEKLPSGKCRNKCYSCRKKERNKVKIVQKPRVSTNPWEQLGADNRLDWGVKKYVPYYKEKHQLFVI